MIEMDWWTGGQQSNSQVFQDDDESTRDSSTDTTRSIRWFARDQLGRRDNMASGQGLRETQH